MGLSIRIIPVLLRRGNSLVKGKQFDSWRSVGHPLQAARIHAARGVDELMLLDLDCGSPDCRMVELLTRDAFTPITVGGGVKNLTDARDLLNAGADKLCVKSKKAVREITSSLGRQAVCFSLEARNGMDVLQEAKEIEGLGAGEILLQSVDRDGMMEGYDLDLIEKVSSSINIPVIASCGAGVYEHMLDAIKAGASAVAAGAMFQFTDQTPLSAARYLADHGVETRV